jgi:hypothetical protein
VKLQVECYAGHRAEQEPRFIRLGDRRIAVEEIVDRWLDPEHRYFKCLGEDGALYLLRHGVQESQWELVLYDARGLEGQR